MNFDGFLRQGDNAWHSHPTNRPIQPRHKPTKQQPNQPSWTADNKQGTPNNATNVAAGVAAGQGGKDQLHKDEGPEGTGPTIFGQSKKGRRHAFGNLASSMLDF